MCTAAAYKTKDFYFGRTLDYEFSYGDEIAVTPRNYVFDFRHAGKLENHYAIIGMAHVAGDYPLYYDAINEKGLGMAGLNFVGNAAYAAAAIARVMPTVMAITLPYWGFSGFLKKHMVLILLGLCRQADYSITYFHQNATPLMKNNM